MVVEGVRACDLIKSLNLGPCYRGSVCLPTIIDNICIYTKQYVGPSIVDKQWMRVMLSGDWWMNENSHITLCLFIMQNVD